MKYIGYHRTSTKEQHLDRGILEITEYCKKNDLPLKKIYADQKTGIDFDRPRYIVLKEDVLEPGDVLIITEVDRLGRSKDKIIEELTYFKNHNIRVMILELPTTLINLSTIDNDVAQMMINTINNMLIELYSSLAHAEYLKKKKRQTEGIEAKKLRGEWGNYGRPRKLSLEDFGKRYEDVISGVIKPFELMNELNLKVGTFYKYRNEYLIKKGLTHTHVVEYKKN